jgi:hypothetical protein
MISLPQTLLGRIRTCESDLGLRWIYAREPTGRLVTIAPSAEPLAANGSELQPANDEAAV